MSDLSISPPINPVRNPWDGDSTTNGVLGAGPVQGTQAAQANAASSGLSIAQDPIGPASSTSISRQSQFFNKLKQLQAQDPDKFKQVLTDIANQLTTAAQSATGRDQKFLTDLADKFTKAAAGDVAALQPPTTNGPTPAASAYQQGAKTAPNGQILDVLAQTAQNGGNGLQTGESGKSGGHHHHGGHGHLSASTQQTLQSVFQELNTAISGGTPPAQDPLPPVNVTQTLNTAVSGDTPLAQDPLPPVHVTAVS